jgi:YD repeat-containing protein
VTHPMSEPWLDWRPIDTIPDDDEDYLVIDVNVEGGFPQAVYWDSDRQLLCVADADIGYNKACFTHWARIPLPAGHQ